MTDGNARYPKILLTGGTGQLGHELEQTLKTFGNIWSPNRLEFDLSDPESLRKKIQKNQPNLIINSAAYTNVEKAESEIKLARTINAEAPKVMAEEANKLNIPLVHYSTDYVFDGEKQTPYTEEDDPNPRNIYGTTKLEGEQAIQKAHDQYLILRTGSLYNPKRGNNFYRTMLKIFENKKEISVVNDQTMAPTSVKFLAKKTTQILKQLNPKKQFERRWKLYNLTENVRMSWFQFALKIYEENNSNTKLVVKRILPVNSNTYLPSLTRPKFSVLNNSLIYKSFQLI
jgi:dTDP-4-dehydrorhamnose reductase